MKNIDAMKRNKILFTTPTATIFSILWSIYSSTDRRNHYNYPPTLRTNKHEKDMAQKRQG
jgi:hypothetical protein